MFSKDDLKRGFIIGASAQQNYDAERREEDRLRKLEKFALRDQVKPDDFDGILGSIRFMREELGIPQTELPTTFEEANRIYMELRDTVPPPTDEQIDRFYLLLAETGGELSGELISSAQVELLIRQMEKAKRQMKRDYDRFKSTDPKDDKSVGPVGILLVLVLGAIYLVSYSIWPEATQGFFYISIIVMAFVSLNLWFFGR